MSLAEAIAAQRVVKGPSCSISVIRAQLDDEDRAALDAAMARTGTPSSVIARALRANGHDVQHQTVQRHRRGECKCPSLTI